MEDQNKRHPMDVATLFQKYGASFINKHKLCYDQLKAYYAIRNCRTASLGGHISQCNSCPHKEISYNSCRNRHCNKCQYVKQLQWADKLQSNLPTCRYFHMVFTLPSSLHKLFYINQKVCYDLLFKATAQSLQKAGMNPQFLGAETGAVSVLHTWGQALTYHPHIHMIVPAGGLSSDHIEWIEAGKKFFLPVRVLSKIYRGIMWTLLERGIKKGKITLPDDLSTLSELKKKVYAKEWNVYTKKPIKSPESVVKYLGKYTHRVAISNNRIKHIDEKQVTFSWKNYRKGSQKGLLTLSHEEFIGRFMRHVLPKGFYKIRYYGILSSVNKEKRERCNQLLSKPKMTSAYKNMSTLEVLHKILGKDYTSCPSCKKGGMLHDEEFSFP